jgi:hypothetical protein
MATVKKIKKAQDGIKAKPKPISKKEEMVESEMFPGKMIPKSKSNYHNGEYAKMVEAGKGKPAMVKKKKPILDDKIYKKGQNPYKTDENGKIIKQKFGGMLKRADGSMSKRGLWDNIRAAKGSGKKPTAAMLKQEKKIKAKSKK